MTKIDYYPSEKTYSKPSMEKVPRPPIRTPQPKSPPKPMPKSVPPPPVPKPKQAPPPPVPRPKK